eukprot:6214452-Pleurochrysis_carterae.AAC.2
MRKELISEDNTLVQVKDNHREEKPKVRKSENVVEVPRERNCAGGACARASVATVNARPADKVLKLLLCYLALTNASVWSLPVLTSDRHALRHVADCRFSAQGNLHRDHDLTAGRPAVLAHTQSLGYWDPSAASHCSCIAGSAFICATEKVRTDETPGMFCIVLHTPIVITASTLDLPILPTPVGS